MGIVFVSFAVNFATFAVKHLDRKVRKGLDPFFTSQCVMF
jgi:hypothetical protein